MSAAAALRRKGQRLEKAQGKKSANTVKRGARKARMMGLLCKER
jgi:hypothetical protein